MKIVYRLFSILLLPAIVSCSDAYLDRILDRAEALMQEHPDSSLTMLKQLSISEINTTFGRARYSLDYAMALDKNWIDTTDVGIIQPALHYYRTSFTNKERFLAHYYYARILENGMLYPEAMQALSEAERFFCRGVDSTYLIRLHSAKARIYTYQFINDKGEQALLEAVRYSKELKDRENQERMLLSLADFYEATYRFEKADSVLSLLGSPLPALTAWKAKSVASLVFGQPADSIRYPEDWRLFCEMAERYPERLEWNTVARYLLFRNEYAEAFTLLSGIDPDRLPVFRQIDYWGQMMDAYAGINDYEKAFQVHQRYSALVEETALQGFQSDLRSMEERYQGKLKEHRNQRLLIMLSILALLLSGTLGWALRRKREKDEMLSELHAEYETLVQIRDCELARNELFAKKLDDRLKALKPYFTDEFPDELYDSSELRRMTEDSKLMLSNIGILFGPYHPKFIVALEEKNLSELEIGYCCLFALGFTGKEIPDKLRRNSLYNASSAIRKKVGLGPHDTNLSIWILKLFRECENSG